MIIRKDGKMYPPMAENKAFLATKGQLAMMGVKEAGNMDEDCVYYIT